LMENANDFEIWDGELGGDSTGFKSDDDVGEKEGIVIHKV
jgi:hypothetical protein